MAMAIAMTMRMMMVSQAITIGRKKWSRSNFTNRLIDRGFEHKIRERLDYWEKLRREKIS